MKALLLTLILVTLILAVPQIKVVYDFNGIVVNKTCYLAKTQKYWPIPIATISVEVNKDKFAKMMPPIRAFIEELRRTPGVYVRAGDDYEEALNRLKRGEVDRVSLWFEVFVFNNKSLIGRIVEKAKSLGLGLAVYYINATNPGPFPSPREILDMFRSWHNEYIEKLLRNMEKMRSSVYLSHRTKSLWYFS
ncbi:hypothetical protein [Pyrobaculum aerophilum]|jgi:hypothetical protein|uniref:Conserved within P. aerophilum, authentic frameshift n=2 Tax=Pyrobaculum aerophilum TaxID=13773 RepID=Q8ZWL8_PYRAE|nr:hypothetical protein [Pyrobaculum aerophilum]AAL63683.1 conserved within P. aerophilum, authentic frameshift [Pyrobaculum aerophilum str. IM2]MCX8137147.1 hypothetical protein [Pyrobaculum aerophilum]HII46752.1 hypothetical protein [Pyrobaculum aerophilum]